MRNFLFLSLLTTLALLLTPQVFAREVSTIDLEKKTVALIPGQVLQFRFERPFQALAVNDPEDITFRHFSSGIWSPWKTLEHEEEGIEDSEVFFVDPSTILELKSSAMADRFVQSQLELSLFFLSPKRRIIVSSEPIELEDHFPESLKQLRSGRVVRVISRQAWGADESLMSIEPKSIEEGNGEANGSGEGKDSGNFCSPIELAYPGQFQMQEKIVDLDVNGKSLLWPWRYSKKIKKIVIHHTAQTLRDLDNDGKMTNSDYEMAMRAIYTYHTVSRKWGDIGYHYLVDPNGNIYEGKAGGKDVIAAHVLCQNTGTIGVAVMGNFLNEQVSEKAFDGLAELLSYLSELYDINPLGKSSFRGAVLPHIVTHAEIGEVTRQHIARGGTQCPGTFLKDRMVSLRSLVAQGGIKPDFAFSWVKPDVLSLKPLSKKDVSLLITNTGEKTWTSFELFEKKKKTPLLKKEGTIPSGGSFSILLPLEASLEAGPQHQQYKVSLNGTDLKKPLNITYEVEKPVFSYQVLSLEQGKSPLLTKEKRDFKIRLRNTSNFPWLSSGKFQLQLEAIGRRGKSVILLPEGEKMFLSSMVSPGSDVSFAYQIPLQKNPGILSKEFLPMIAHEKGLKGERILLRVPVEEPRFMVELEPKTKLLKKGFDQEVTLLLRNLSNFDVASKMLSFQIGAKKEMVSETIPAGETAEIFLPVRVGYQEDQIEIRGRASLINPPAYFPLKIRRQKIPLVAHVRTKGTVRLMAKSLSVKSDGIELQNAGNVTWFPDGPEKVLLQGNYRGSKFSFPLEKPVEPGESFTFVPDEPKRISRSQMVRFELFSGDRKIPVKGEPLSITFSDRSPRKIIPSVQASIPSEKKMPIPPMRVLLHDVIFPVTVMWQDGSSRMITEQDLGSDQIIRLETDAEEFLEIISISHQKTFGSKTYNDNRYRGILEFRMVDGKPVVINQLSLEKYLKGIAEEPESDDIPQEKRKVIAVLARSYALHYLISGYEKFSGKPYNASDDPAVFQKYLGYSFEQRSPKWQKALKDTEGEILFVEESLDPKALKEERVLRAAYFSCTDGNKTKTPEEAGWTQEYFKRFSAVFPSVEDLLGDDPSRQGATQCGHQVGLSGYGATQMARQGSSYREIIEYYYRHVNLEKW